MNKIIKVVCIDETEGDKNGLKLLTNGKVYDVYEYNESCYYTIGDDGYPITPLKIYFEPLRDNNLEILIPK